MFDDLLPDDDIAGWFFGHPGNVREYHPPVDGLFILAESRIDQIQSLEQLFLL